MSSSFDNDRVAELFQQAKDLSPEDQARFLDENCHSDSHNLRQQVEQLLAADRRAPRPSGGKAEDSTGSLDVTKEPTVRAIGPYRLLQKIGEGGMGSIWMAEQEHPVRRRVALKLIKPGVESRQVVARFEAERQALAMMDHQNIAKVLDAGATVQGQPFFVMELVKGIPITEYCDRHKLSINDRLDLFIPVCNAVQHAHQKGIIHRDLKPSNVLVCLHDGRPVPKIIDFGLAKALQHQLKLTDKTMFTEFGQVVGTLQYMSPEQAEMNQLDVDTRTDIYSLGVMLYELLTGSTPIETETAKRHALLHILQLIREKDPPRPSARLSSFSQEAASGISEQRRIEPGRLQKILRGELDWIVMKALEKDRNRRYDSASALADELRRFVEGEPIVARPPTMSYRLRKLIAQYRHAVIAIASIIVLLLSGIGTTLWQAIRANRESARAKEQAAIAQHETYVSDMYAAGLASTRGDLRLVEHLLNRHRTAPASEAGFRGWEWSYLNWVVQRHQRSQKIPLDFGPYMLDASPNGAHIAVGHYTGATFTMLNRNGLGKKESFGRLGLQHFWNPGFAVFSNDSSKVAYPTDDMSSIQIMDLHTRANRELFEGRQGDIVRGVTFSPDDATIASVSNFRGIELHELNSNSPPTELLPFRGTGNNTLGLAFLPDDLLAGAADDGSLHIWDLRAGGRDEQIINRGTGHVLDLSCSPDGIYLASGYSDGCVTIMDLQSRDLVIQLRPGQDEARAVTFAPQGNLLAVGTRDRFVAVYTVPQFQQLDKIPGYSGMYALDFMPNGDLVFVGQGNEVVQWKRDQIGTRGTANGPIQDLVFASKDRLLLGIVAGSQSVQVWSVAGGFLEQRGPIEIPFEVGCIAASSNGSIVVGNRNRLELRFYPTDNWTSSSTADLESNPGAVSTAFSPDGAKIAVGCADGTLLMLGATDHEKLWTHRAASPVAPGIERICMSFSPDGRTLLTGASDGQLTLWDVESGEIVRDLGLMPRPVFSVAFDESGARFTAGMFGPLSRGSSQLTLWDRRSFGRTAIPSSPFTVHGARFVDGGNSLMIACGDQALRLIDLSTGRELLLLDVSPHVPVVLAVSSNETTVALGCRDGAVLLFKASPQ